LDPSLYPITITCTAVTHTLPDQLAIGPETAVLLRHPLHLRYEEAIILTSYRTWTTGSDLAIALQWHALAAVNQEYKLFVHMLDEHNIVVRQYDAIPCNWACPTSGWQPGQHIEDVATLPLAGLPPGTYTLALGLYDAATGARPFVTTPTGEPVPDGYYLLPDLFSINPTQLP
jgi:hypothetical protein